MDLIIESEFYEPIIDELGNYIDYIPKSSKFKGESCRGVLIHILNRDKFSPIKFGICIIDALVKSHPTHFSSILDSKLDEVTRIDKFYGSNHLRKALLGSAKISEVFEQIETQSDEWDSIRKEFLFY
jgi:uncharacterized protein YbbC (DUF1343 family)